MKRKTIVGLIAIATVVVVAMFTGCIGEEAPIKVPETTETITPQAETPTPVASTPTVISTPTQTPISVEANIKVGSF